MQAPGIFQTKFKDYLTHLLSKRSWGSDVESMKKIVICKTARLKDKHSSIEIQRRRTTHFSRPSDLLRALLAIPNLVLWGVAPCFLTEAVHHCIKVPILAIKQMVYVVIYLNVCVQIDHLAVLLKLQIQSNGSIQ